MKYLFIMLIAVSAAGCPPKQDPPQSQVPVKKYYRIKQVDKDSNATYSKTILVEK